MDILVIGSSGMLGHLITQYFIEKGHAVTDIARRGKFRSGTINADIADIPAITEFLSAHTPELIINCAALLLRDSEEHKEKAILINSYFPHFLRAFYKNTATRIIQVSTGGVYDGTAEEYSEGSPHTSESFYGKSKSLGELTSKNCLTVRSDFWGADTRQDGKSLFNWAATSHGSVSGYSNVMFNGVSSLEFARFIEAIMNRNVSGAFNLHSLDAISKADFIGRVCGALGKTDVNVIPSEEPRKRTVLTSERDDIPYVPKSFDEQLGEMRNWILSHREMYPHYFEGEQL